MRILLLGEYSNVHWTLAQALRRLGHDVCVASNGDFWKNYPRDIDLDRKIGSPLGTIDFYRRLTFALARMRGYDVVQLINPMFFEVNPRKNLIAYKYLKRHNRKTFLGAFGMDFFWVDECRQQRPLRYSDFNFGDNLRTDEIAMREVDDWVGTDKETANRYIADNCNGIIAGLYEYYACYKRLYNDKLQFIPFPIDVDAIERVAPPVDGPVRFFIGISQQRSKYKGTDIMLDALEKLHQQYPDRCEIVKAVSVPFEQYQHMMDSSHVILDQLYSYTPAMNALLAMAKGLVVVGGGEEENYQILGEDNLRPIVNVLPNADDVYRKLEQLVVDPQRISTLSDQSRAYVERHHNADAVARKYLDFWMSK